MTEQLRYRRCPAQDPSRSLLADSLLPPPSPASALETFTFLAWVGLRAVLLANESVRVPGALTDLGTGDEKRQKECPHLQNDVPPGPGHDLVSKDDSLRQLSSICG